MILRSGGRARWGGVPSLDKSTRGLGRWLAAWRRAAALFISAAFVLFGALVPAHAALDVDKVERSIVRIEVGRSFGSGFFVTNDGIIATNYHVIAGADRIVIRPSGDVSGYEGRVLWQSKQMDLALLSVQGVTRPPLTLFMGDPPRASNVNVVGFSAKCDAAAGGRTLHTCATSGVVSLLENDRARARRVVQSDAVINRGSSGGPLLDDCGRVVGVAAQGYGGAGGEALYVAIHTTTLVRFMGSEQLKDLGLKPVTTKQTCKTNVAGPDEEARKRADSARKSADSARRSADDANQKAQDALETTKEAQAQAEAAAKEAEAATKEAERLKAQLKAQEDKLAAEQAKQEEERARQRKVNLSIVIGVGVTVLLTLLTLGLALRKPRQQLIQVVEQVSRTVMPSNRSAAGATNDAVRRRSTIAPPGSPADHGLLLIVTMSDGHQVQYELDAAKLGQTWFGVTFGRHKGLVDHVIESPELSRRHFRIRWQNQCFEIEDLNSTNGTLLNGVALLAYKPNRLRMEDEIKLGRVKARVSKLKHETGTN